MKRIGLCRYQAKSIARFYLCTTKQKGRNYSRVKLQFETTWINGIISKRCSVHVCDQSYFICFWLLVHSFNDESYVVIIKERNTSSLFSGHLMKNGHLSLISIMKTDYVQVIKLWEEYSLWILVHLCLFDSVCCTSLLKKLNGNFLVIAL
jgi:hypothetical protein